MRVIIFFAIYFMIGLGAWVKTDSHPMAKEAPTFVKDAMVVLWPMAVGAIIMDEAIKRRSSRG